MRRQIDGLAILARDVIKADPLSGAMFAFINARRNKLKILVWERNGFILWYKRLERHRFHWPRVKDAVLTVSGEELNRPLTTAEMDRMVACVAAAREGAGDAVDLTVDCHWRFAPTEAIRIARALAPLNLLWFEDPCPPENYRDVAEIRALGIVPILTGENLNRRHGFWDLITHRGCDLVAPDIQKCGGMLEAKRIGELAEMQGIRFAPHNISSPLGTLASAHVCATLPNFVALEFHGSDVPFWNDLILRPDVPGPVIKKGRIPMTDAPGLGCELDEAVARKYAKPGEKWFE